MSERLSIAGDGTATVPLVKHLLRPILTVLQGLKLSGLVKASQNCQDGGSKCPIKNSNLGSLLRIRSISCNRKGMGGCVIYSLTTVVAILNIAGYAMLCYANKQEANRLITAQVTAHVCLRYAKRLRSFPNAVFLANASPCKIAEIPASFPIYSNAAPTHYPQECPSEYHCLRQ
jgi:hypothetical protein